MASFHAALVPATFITQITAIYDGTDISCLHETSLALKGILLSDPKTVDDSALASIVGRLRYCLLLYMIFQLIA